jgi:peroxiredoxin
MKMKFMDMKDTSWNVDYKFFFNKIKNDSIYPIAFNSERFSHGNYYDNKLYTGNEFVTYSKTVKTASIMPKAKWSNKISDLSHNSVITFYSPFTSDDASPLPTASDYTDGQHHFKLIGKELMNNMNCYHIREIEFPQFDSSKIGHTLKKKTDYWINTEDMIPVKYAIESTILQYGDTLSQYESRTLTKYVLNNAKNLDALQLSAIPSYCHISDYTEAKKVALLEKNTSAPDWNLATATGNRISLSGYKGKLVLIDFFYKNCYSCLKAIPALDSLYGKYKKDGLQLIGIDPVDSVNKDLLHFISVAGIVYPVVFDNKQLAATNYRVSGYPTTYLIDKNGKVIYASVGFDESMKGTLEEIIESNL